MPLPLLFFSTYYTVYVNIFSPHFIVISFGIIDWKNVLLIYDFMTYDTSINTKQQLQTYVYYDIYEHIFKAKF